MKWPKKLRDLNVSIVETESSPTFPTRGLTRSTSGCRHLKIGSLDSDGDPVDGESTNGELRFPELLGGDAEYISLLPREARSPVCAAAAQQQ